MLKELCKWLRGECCVILRNTIDLNDKVICTLTNRMIVFYIFLFFSFSFFVGIVASSTILRVIFDSYYIEQQNKIKIDQLYNQYRKINLMNQQRNLLLKNIQSSVMLTNRNKINFIYEDFLHSNGYKMIMNIDFNSQDFIYNLINDGKIIKCITSNSKTILIIDNDNGHVTVYKFYGKVCVDDVVPMDCCIAELDSGSYCVEIWENSFQRKKKSFQFRC